MLHLEVAAVHHLVESPAAVTQGHQGHGCLYVGRHASRASRDHLQTLLARLQRLGLGLRERKWRFQLSLF